MFTKLKIDKFNNFLQINMPEQYRFDLTDSDNPEVVFYYINEASDVDELLSFEFNLPEENRVIAIFEKGKKLRDSLRPIINNGFKMKAPMLCSLNDKLSAFCFMKVRD